MCNICSNSKKWAKFGRIRYLPVWQLTIKRTILPSASDFNTIPDPAFWVKTDPDPDLIMTKWKETIFRQKMANAPFNSKSHIFSLYRSNIDCLESGSSFLIRIRIQGSHCNTDPHGSRSKTLIIPVENVVGSVQSTLSKESQYKLCSQRENLRRLIKRRREPKSNLNTAQYRTGFKRVIWYLWTALCSRGWPASVGLL